VFEADVSDEESYILLSSLMSFRRLITSTSVLVVGVHSGELFSGTMAFSPLVYPSAGAIGQPLDPRPEPLHSFFIGCGPRGSSAKAVPRFSNRLSYSRADLAHEAAVVRYRDGFSLSQYSTAREKLPWG
jgi:hypothetical protein